MRRRTIRNGIAALLALTLSACILPPPLTSEAVSLPPDARGIEPALEGDFWLPGGEGAEAGFDIATVTRDGEGRYHIVYRDRTGDVSWSSDEEATGVELIRTGHAGIDVLLVQADGRTLYALAFRSRAGTWVLFPFVGGVDRPGGGLREAWLAGIAARHGLALSYAAGEGELRITGHPDAAAIAALFSDPAFLTGLQLDPADGKRLFPAGGRLPAANDSTAWWSESYSRQLESAPFPLAPGDQVRPGGIAGRYQLDGRPVTVQALPDGSLSFDYPPLEPGRDSWTQRVHLITLDGKSWLALSERQRDKDPATPPAEDGRFTYALASQDKGGNLTFEGICLSDPHFSATLAALVEASRAEAGQRHGIMFDHARISGRLEAASLRALYRDPQFQVGLAPDQEKACGRQVFQRRKGKARP